MRHRFAMLVCSAAVLATTWPGTGAVSAPATGPTPAAQAADGADLDAMARIRQEGLAHSQVMDVASYLSDVIGPRLTGSPGFKAAGDYVIGKLGDWQIDARLEPWGPFDRGWSNEFFSANVLSPAPFPMIGYPRAWTPGTNGPLVAEAVLPTLQTEQDLVRLRGTLKGKFVLVDPPRDVAPPLTPLASRYTADELTDLEKVDTRPPRQPRTTPEQRAFLAKRTQFLATEGVAALVECSRITDGGAVLAAASGARQANDPPTPPQITLAVEHYNRIARTLARGIPVQVQLDIRNTWTEPAMSFNVIGEIRGTDKPEEVVLLGAHLDSWSAGSGAADNAVGCAMVMEALRILRATGLRTRRTVRLGLWGAEEHGSLGAKAYIADHLVDARTQAQKAGYDRFAVYFNLDAGGGAIRGIYLQGNAAAGPVFRTWAEPFRDLGMTAVSIRNSNVNSDHQAFDRVGLPGFQFMQDPLDYDTRVHHTNMDTVERLPATDVKQNAVILAAFAYRAATHGALVPHKPPAGQ